jgi:phosphate starvation-inducible PhoH-like protein
MTAKTRDLDEHIFHVNDLFHHKHDETPATILGLPSENVQRRRKGKHQKQKKKMERSELAYYYEELNSTAQSIPGITRLSDFGFSVLDDAPVDSKKYYENYENLSAKEKHKFESKFTVPKNRHQMEYVAALKNRNKKIVLCTGPAGTGKTLFSTEYGVRQFLTGEIEKLIFTRPSVSVDEDLGFLPGTLEDKMAPWIRPIYDILYSFLSPTEVKSLMDEKLIEIAPLGYMRGRTFKNAWIVADEMQNSTVSQMKMLLTRLGENSRIIVTGDLEQFDRPDNLNGLEDFLSKFKGKRSDSISSFEFDRDDIQREEVVKELLEIYAAYDIPVSYKTTDTDNNSSRDSEDN